MLLTLVSDLFTNPDIQLTSMSVKQKWSKCYRVIYCIKWYKLYSFRFADNFLSRDDPTMFTFIRVILMFCICFKLSQGKIILCIHFTKSTISRYDSTSSPQHSRPTLWSIHYLGLQGGRICLSCNGVVKPRDCSTVVVCGTHEVSTNNFSFQFFYCVCYEN